MADQYHQQPYGGQYGPPQPGYGGPQPGYGGPPPQGGGYYPQQPPQQVCLPSPLPAPQLFARQQKQEGQKSEEEEEEIEVGVEIKHNSANHTVNRCNINKPLPPKRRKKTAAASTAGKSPPFPFPISPLFSPNKHTKANHTTPPASQPSAAAGSAEKHASAV